MKQVISIFFLLFLTLTWVQGQEVVFGGKLSDRDKGGNLSDVEVKAIANGSEVYSTTTNRRGAYTVKMPVGKVYKIKYIKSGYVTKTMSIDLTSVNEEDLPIGGEIMPPVDIDLFKKRDNVDFSFLEEEPVVSWDYDERNLIMDWDRSVYNKMKKRIDDLLAEAEDKSKENEAKYNALIKEADGLFESEKYEEALEKYEEALHVPGKQAEEHPNKRLMEIEDILQQLAEKELEESQSNQEYQNLLDEAENLTENKEYDNAIDKYHEALKIKPEEQFPHDKIEEIKELQKTEQEEKAYNDLITEADNLFEKETYNEASEKYKEAAKLLPEKDYPRDQIKLIDEKLAAQKELEANKEKYEAAIAEADRLFNEEKYERSIVEYEKAIGFNDEANHPKDQIEIAEEKLKEQEEQAKNQEEFDALVKAGDQLFNSKNYNDAISKYDDALALMSSSEVEKKRQDAADALAALENEKQTEEKINELLASAKSSFDSEEYENALTDYNKVLELEKTNKKAIEGKNKSEQALKKQNELNAAKIEFNELVSKADDLYDTEKWVEAEKMYQAANKVIEDDAHVSKRLSDVKLKIEENKELAEQQEKIQELLDQAARQKSDELWDKAIASYEEILDLNANHTEAKDLLDETKALRDESIANKEKQAKFDKLKSEADQLFANKKWKESKEIYLEAKEVLPSEKVDDQLKIIEKELSKLSSEKEREENYNKAIEEAEVFESSEEYQKAIDKYNDALAYKENDATAKNRIKDLEKKIKEIEDEQLKEEKYQAAIEDGNKALDDKDFAKAIKLFDDALEIKPVDPNALKLKKDAKAELDKLQSNEEQYQNLLAEGKAEKEEGELEKAKRTYEDAQQMRPNDPIPQNAIVEIDELLRQREEVLAENENQKELEKSYQNKLDLANVAAQNFKYEKAIEHLKEASKIKPEEEFPKKKINEYQTLLDQIEEQNSKGDKYKNVIRKADAAFDSKNYKESIELYNEALGVKEEDEYANSQIIKAKNYIENKENEEMLEAYQEVIERANLSFNTTEYEEALELYEEALTVKPGDKFASNRRDETRQILDDLASKAESNKEDEDEFNRLIKEADEYFDNESYIDAKEAYEKALEIKSNDVYAIERAQESVTLAKSKVNAGDEARYQKILTKADEYFDAENYDKAKSLYERALGLRSYDEYPKDKLVEIKRILEGPVKKEVNLEYLGEEEGISIEEGAALLSQAEVSRKNQKSENVMKSIRKNEENVENKTLSDYEERQTYQSEITRLLDDAREVNSDENKEHTDYSSQIDDYQYSITQQKIQENNFERNAVLRENDNLTYIIDDNRELYKKRKDDHYDDIETLNKIENDYKDQKVAESKNNRRNIQKTTDEIDDIADDRRTDAERGTRMRRANEDGVRKLEESNEIRDFERNEDNYDKIQRLQDEATLTEIARSESSKEKTIIQKQIADDILALDGELKRKSQDQQRQSQEENRKSDALLTEASDQYKESKENNDIKRKQTVEDIKRLQSDQELANKKAKEKKSNDIQNNVDETVAVKILKEEGVREMKDDLLAINEDLKSQQDRINRDNRLRAENESKERQDVVDDLDLTKEKESAARKQKNEKTKENNESIKAVEASIGAGESARKKANKDKKMNTQKVLDDLESKKIEVTPKIANSLGDDFPEGVSQETYVRKDKNDLPNKVVTRRIVVKDGHGEVYIRIQTRNGITYSKNGSPITEQSWIKGTESAKLERHF
ncbi:MAG: hypothetical protein WED10_10820 [Brumimicrobium sp.]